MFRVNYKFKKYNSYLEIGTFKDELFSKLYARKKLELTQFLVEQLEKQAMNFSINNDRFDCIFIDGLHYYHQVRKDILNSLETLNENGIILLHDCLPNNHYEQAVPRCQMTWNGDVWKVIVECRTKETIDTYTCNADFGIGVILKRKKKILNLGKQNFSKLKFEDYFYNYKDYMNIIEFDELIKII